MATAEKNCSRCHHPQSWHRLDDADPANYGPPETWKFRCIGYDCERPGPLPKSWPNACDCPDFKAPSEETKHD